MCLDNQLYKPEQIGAYILAHLKKLVIDHLKRSTSTTVDAVIAVSAYFTDSPRKATILAAEIAGIKVLTLINEPTAASIAYGYQKVRKSVFLFFFCYNN